MSSLKRSSVSLFAVLFVLCFAVSAFAQVITPRPSQTASVMQRIGATDVTITYSRPGVKGRQIWGDPPAGWAANAKGEATLDNQNERPKGAPIVPWGHVWRTGANEATMFVVTVSYGRCQDSPTCAWAPRWKTYGRSGAPSRSLTR